MTSALFKALALHLKELVLGVFKFAITCNVLLTSFVHTSTSRPMVKHVGYTKPNFINF